MIDYGLVRSARVYPLGRHFGGDRKRHLRTRQVRQLASRPAVFIRLKSNDERFSRIERNLGSRLVDADTIALPVPDPDTLALEISARIPQTAQVNRGGQRRPKRSR